MSQVYTLLDGPRGVETNSSGVTADVRDHTVLWVTRWGMPWRIRDALGGEALLTRGSAFPSLVTAVQGADGSGSLVLKASAVYDARGRVTSSTVHNPLGDNINATTTYTYDDRWNAPTIVAAPGSAPVTVAYDTLNGNPLWQQVGSDPARRVTFLYSTNWITYGMPSGTQYPANAQGQVATDGMGYDAQGNMVLTRSPLGYLTRHFQDAYGRDTLVVVPIRADSSDTEAKLLASGARTRTGYDIIGRVLWTEAVGPAVTQHPAPQGSYTGPGITPAERLRVENTYGAGGELLKVERWSIPDSTGVGVLRNIYTYDRAGRKLTENDGSGGVQQFQYDPAGRSTWITTQRGFLIRSEYDALGRLVRRTVPSTTYSPQCPPQQSPCARFPFYANGSTSGWTIPGEVFTYRFDVAGNQVWAENLDAKVARSYYPGGALRADTIRMRSYNGIDYTQHVYGIEYGYDTAGRTAWVKHPGNLVTSGGQTDSYAYDAVTGALTQVSGRTGEVFQYGYDRLDREIWHTYPNGIERTTYDLEGRRTARTDSTGAQGVFNHETFDYDARGKLTHAYTDFNYDAAHSDNWYSGLGNLVATNWNNVEDNAVNIEHFTTDAMGNQAHRHEVRDGADETYLTTYQPGTGRITFVAREWPAIPNNQFHPDSTYRYYDTSGNVSWAIQSTHGPDTYGADRVARSTTTWNLYGTDEKLRVLQMTDLKMHGNTGVEFLGLFSEYRYDALGRRILERTRRDTLCNSTAAGECASTVTRFVWSGDQLLWELRADGSNGLSQELTNGTGGQYGRVSYLHAGGIDRPLVITKGSTSVVPHDNWRGMFATGTLTNGERAECNGSTPVNCAWIIWPGWRTTVSNSWLTPPDPGTSDWWGGLVDGMRDASGRMYMRNRYYDPATGQFTQTDPIGLSGGLNAYSFAEGDPVSYSDPYGTTVLCNNTEACRIWVRVLQTASRAARSGNDNIAEHGRAVVNGLIRLATADDSVYLTVRERGAFRRAMDWLAPKYAPVTASGPCSHVDEYCPTGRGWAVMLDPGWSKFKGVSAEVRFVHELGHILSYLGGEDGEANTQDAVDFEDHYRAIRSCRARRDHGWTGSRCQ